MSMAVRTKRWKIGVAGLLLSVALLSVAAIAQAPYQPKITALATVLPGMWQVDTDADAPKTFCVADPAELLQIAHHGPACSRFVILNDPKTATVSYSCKAGGYGQTNLRVGEDGVLRIRTQGILDKAPFDYSATAKRLGNCTTAELSRRR
jgi:hypothetical protein